MTEDEFVGRWRNRLAGWGLYGVWTEATQGPLARAARALDIPGQTEDMLKALYRDAQPSPPPKPLETTKTPAANGAAGQPRGQLNTPTQPKEKA